MDHQLKITYHLVHSFLTEKGHSKTVKALRKELQGSVVFEDDAEDITMQPLLGESLPELVKEWRALKASTLLSSASNPASDSGSSSSSEESDSSPSSSSSSESESSSDSDSDDKPVSSKTAPLSKISLTKPATEKPKPSSQAPSSNITSSESSEDELDTPVAVDGFPKSTNAPTSKEIVNGRKRAHSSSAASSSSSSSQASSSEDADTEAALKKLATAAAPLLPSTTSEVTVTTKKRRTSEGGSGVAASSTPSESVSGKPKQTSGKTLKDKRKTNVPFQRIKASEVEQHDVRDNRYEAKAAPTNDYGARAHQDLIITRGAGFRKEKNKKKRGSYRGGEITMQSHSFKFTD